MSLETDARDALIEAIRTKNDVEVEPQDFDNVKPSDPGLGVRTGAAWQTTLEIAAGLLADRGYSVAEPALEKAAELREQVLLESSIYLEILCGQSVGVALAKAAAAAAIAAAVTYAAVRKKPRKATVRKARSRPRRRP